VRYAVTKLLGYLSLCAFALSAIAHVLTFVPSVRVSMSYTWWLRLAAMAAFGAMFVSMSFLQRRRPGGVNPNPMDWRTSKRLEREFSNDMEPFVPRYLYYAETAMFAYVLISFTLFFWQAIDGSPKADRGKFFLVQRHKVVRQIAESEFHRREASIVRGFSGLWMFFSIRPAMYSLFVEERLRGK
jgi:hypothetical protein